MLLFFWGVYLSHLQSVYVCVKHLFLWFFALSGAASDPSGTCGIKGEKRSVPRLSQMTELDAAAAVSLMKNTSAV